MKTIIISVEGGVIQNIGNIPDGVAVEVRDYDIDGVDPDRLSITPDGEAVVSVWMSDGVPKPIPFAQSHVR